MSKDKDLEILRHSTSHIMAMATKKFFPEVKFGIGPTIEEGFYYDFDLSAYATSSAKASEVKKASVDKGKQTLQADDLPKIEAEMKKLISQNLKFEKKEISFKEAEKQFFNQPYKLELIKDLKKAGEKKVSIYQSGDFIDLCKGPHIKSTKEIGAFKLLKIAGAYWRGDEKNKMLSRIYGTAFKTQKELDSYLEILKQAEERDHRKVGQEQELFMVTEEVGAGLILWQPKGAILRKVIEDFTLNTYLENGYQLLMTPHLGSEKLFSISGHLDFYKEGMYSPMEIEKENYYIKPMNCPFHLMIYKNSLKSYRDLPIKYTELGTVYRYERSGVLHGLLRVRGFTQDDGHIICRSDQLEAEIIKALKLTKYILETFGFKDFKVVLSVRDPKNKKKYLGKDASWSYAETALEKGAKKVGWQVAREEGEAVFYGPKVDVKVKDVIGREWQISTLQVDFNLPRRFKITYIDKDSKKKEPFMLHRALLGSLERFIGVLIENYAGAFPVWLAPIQVQIIPVSSNFIKDAEGLALELKEKGIRVWVDDLNETVGYKIRKGEKRKIPYMLVIGGKEAKGKTLNVRVRGQKEVIEMTKNKFFAKIIEEVKEKEIELKKSLK